MGLDPEWRVEDVWFESPEAGDEELHIRVGRTPGRPWRVRSAGAAVASTTPVREMLRRIGVGHVFGAAEQAKPDGAFLTCPKPNPEELAAMERVVALSSAPRPSRQSCNST